MGVPVQDLVDTTVQIIGGIKLPSSGGVNTLSLMMEDNSGEIHTELDEVIIVEAFSTPAKVIEVDKIEVTGRRTSVPQPLDKIRRGVRLSSSQLQEKLKAPEKVEKPTLKRM